MPDFACFNERYVLLLDGLDELIELLRHHGEEHWADWLAADRRSLTRHDSQGIEHLLSAFGGMGSLTDLHLSGVNGHRVTDAEESGANERLSTLRSRVHTLARDMQRELG